MKHRIYILLSAMLFCTALFAQNVDSDKELSLLINIVESLRVSTPSSFDAAVVKLTDDQRWTMMDETGAVREGKECKASEGVPGFKLNRILSRVSGKRKFVTTHGNMVNGQTEAYDYSLFERALKPKASVKYTMKGREGIQTFVIVPFDKTAKFTVSILVNGKSVSDKVKVEDGRYFLEWTRNLPTKNQTFELSVKNNTSAAQSFVILNHNSRKR